MSTRPIGSVAAPSPTPGHSDYDPELPWTVHPQVSLRPESFGALAYHFGTRRLSFLKSPLLLKVVNLLAEQPTGHAACEAAGVPFDQRRSYDDALSTLAESGMICERKIQ